MDKGVTVERITQHLYDAKRDGVEITKPWQITDALEKEHDKQAAVAEKAHEQEKVAQLHRDRRARTAKEKESADKEREEALARKAAILTAFAALPEDRQAEIQELHPSDALHRFAGFAWWAKYGDSFAAAVKAAGAEKP